MKTLLIDQDPHFLANLESILYDQWPCTDIITKCTQSETAFEELVKRKYDLLFLDVKQFIEYHFDLDKISNWVKQTVYMADNYDFAAMAIHCGASGYLLKPLQARALREVMEECLHVSLISETANNRSSDHKVQDQIICIHTIDGAEFLKPTEIIRCEGLQKCTRIVTQERSDIISSYNIGIFRELLKNLGFFQPHKSHLINLRYITKYHREGTITMMDSSNVPLARRRKNELFQLMRCPTNYR